MRACSVLFLKPGMILAQPLFTYRNKKRALLLGRGAELDEHMIDRLNKMGYASIYIEEKGTEHIIPEENLAEATQNSALINILEYYDDVRHNLNMLMKTIKTPVDQIKFENMHLSMPPTQKLRDSIKEIIQDLFIIGKVQRYKVGMNNSRSNAIHYHALNTGVLSLLMGNYYGYTDAEQASLCMGAFLHDIGKTALDNVYGKSQWELRPAELKEMRMHPQIGLDLLQRVRTINEIERQIVLQHHERQDGTGFPSGLVGDNSKPLRSYYTKPRHIFRFAEIVAIANVFDNLVSGHLVNRYFSPKEALGEMLSLSGDYLNSEIVESFFSMITLYPTASNVVIVKHDNKELIGAKCVVEQPESADFSNVIVVVLTDGKGRRIPAERLEVHLGESEQIKLRYDC